jgi:hypothetical protein
MIHFQLFIQLKIQQSYVAKNYKLVVISFFFSFFFFFQKAYDFLPHKIVV